MRRRQTLGIVENLPQRASGSCAAPANKPCPAAAFSDKKKIMRAGSKPQSRSETQTLDDAITCLVKRLKRDLHRKYGRVDYDKLRKDGFSDYLLMRLKGV